MSATKRLMEALANGTLGSEPIESHTGDSPFNFEALVGERVRRLREARGWTQQQLAVALSEAGLQMRQPTVARLEAGTRPIRVNDVMTIATVFAVPADELWRSVEAPVTDDQVDDLVKFLDVIEDDLDASKAREERLQLARARVSAEYAEEAVRLQQLAQRRDQLLTLLASTELGAAALEHRSAHPDESRKLQREVLRQEIAEQGWPGC